MNALLTYWAKKFYGLPDDSAKTSAAKRCTPIPYAQSPTFDNVSRKKTDDFMRGAIVPINDDSSDLWSSERLEERAKEIYGI